MEECIHQRPKGGLCGRKVKKGSEYCPYHHKKMNGMARVGDKKQLSRLLGLSGDEAMSYEAFLAQERPHDLANELYQLRALLVAYRKAYNASNEELKEAFIENVEDTAASYLISETGMAPEKAYHIANLLLPPVADAYDEFLESMAVSGDYVKKVRDLIRDIATVAEKAVKIKDGLTLNLVVNNQEFLDFIHDVVFIVVTDPQDRAKLAQLAQIYFGRGGKSPISEVVEAEFELKE